MLASYFDLQAEANKKSKGNSYKLKIDEESWKRERAEKNFFPSWGFFSLSKEEERERVPHRFRRMSCFHDCLIIEE